MEKRRNKKRIYQCGGLDKFDRNFLHHQNHKSDFKIIYSGLSRKMVFDGGSRVFRYFGEEGTGFVDGAYFSSMVKRDVDKYLENNDPPSAPNDKPNLCHFNLGQIPYVIGQPVQALDLNNCYFRTAYNLGYITEKTYKNAMDKIKHKKKIKDGLLVSIGMLNKLDLEETYKDGVCVHKRLLDDIYKKYSPFYWKIIQSVYDFLMDIAQYLGRDFYMCLMDCIYFNLERRADVIEYMKTKPYNYKLFICEFTEIDHIKVKWDDWKDARPKEMNHSHRDIWRQVKPDDDSHEAWNSKRDLIKYIRENKNKKDLQFWGIEEYRYLFYNGIIIPNETKIEIMNSKDIFIVNKNSNVYDSKDRISNNRLSEHWFKIKNYNRKKLAEI